MSKALELSEDPESKYCRKRKISETETPNEMESIQDPSEKTTIDIHSQIAQNDAQFSKDSKYMEEDSVSKKNFCCKEPTCSERFGKRTTLIKHMNLFHSSGIEIISKDFEDYQTFIEWKNNFEKDYNVRFVLARGEKSTYKQKLCSYVCHRQGHYKDKSWDANTRKRALKAQGSNKINSICISYLNALVSNLTGKVNVEYCNYHSHDIELQHIKSAKQSENKLPVTSQWNEINEVNNLDKNKELYSSEEYGDQPLFGESPISKKYIQNIRKIYCLNEKRHPNDGTSLLMILDELYQTEANPILYFKKQGELLDNHEKDDFLLVIQTDFMRKMMRKHGNSFIGIDTNHCTNVYKFVLKTIIVLDDCLEGIPVAFLISNNESEYTLKTFFSSVKENLLDEYCYEPVLKFFMSDPASATYHAWVDVFGVPEKQFWCSWHVQRAWEKKLNEFVEDNLVKKEIREMLRTIVREENLTIFHELKKSFVDYMREKSLTAFCGYLVMNYFLKWTLWSQCEKNVRQCPTTNVHCESFHKVLKIVYFSKKSPLRLDELLCLLLKISRDKMYDTTVKSTKGKSTKKTCLSNKQHSEHTNICSNMITVVEENEIWNVQSTKSNINLHTVTKHDFTCQCEVKCVQCNICIHYYKCSCTYSLVHKSICKHIHAVSMKYGRSLESLLEPCVNIEEDFLSNDIALSYNTLAKPKPSVSFEQDILIYKEAIRILENKNLRMSDEKVSFIKMNAQILKNILSTSKDTLDYSLLLDDKT